MCCSLEISARAELYMKVNARYREVVWWMIDFDMVLFSLLPITKFQLAVLSWSFVPDLLALHGLGLFFISHSVLHLVGRRTWLVVC